MESNLHYNEKVNSLQAKNSMNRKRADFGIVHHKGMIYVAGGRDSDIHGKCEKYNVEEDQWSEMPDLSVPRCDHSLTLFN